VRERSEFDSPANREQDQANFMATYHLCYPSYNWVLAAKEKLGKTRKVKGCGGDQCPGNPPYGGCQELNMHCIACDKAPMA